MIRLILILLLIPTATALLNAPNATVNEPFALAIDPYELGVRSIIGVYLPESIEVEVPDNAYYDADEHLLIFEDLDGPISLTGLALASGDAYYEIVYIVPPRRAGIREVTASISLPEEAEPIEPVQERPDERSSALLVAVLLTIAISVALGYLMYKNLTIR